MTTEHKSWMTGLLELLEYAGYVITATREGHIAVSTRTGQYVTTLLDPMPSGWASSIRVEPRMSYDEATSSLPAGE